MRHTHSPLPLLHSPQQHPFSSHGLDIYYTSRYARRRHWRPTLYSCLENPMDRGAWWAVVHGVAKSQRPLFLSSPQGATVSLSETVQKWREYRRQCQRFLTEAPPPAAGESRRGPRPASSPQPSEAPQAGLASLASLGPASALWLGVQPCSHCTPRQGPPGADTGSFHAVSSAPPGLCLGWRPNSRTYSNEHLGGSCGLF